MTLSNRLATLLFGELATPPVTANRAHGWCALPGGRLELRDTGFVISLVGDRQQMPYILHDPDGRSLASAFLLQPLKQHAEQCASDRAEFGS
jgi:hypothetical protein